MKLLESNYHKKIHLSLHTSSSSKVFQPRIGANYEDDQSRQYKMPTAIYPSNDG